MKHKLLEPAGLVVNTLSIASYFFLANALHLSDVPPAVGYIAWMLFAAGFILILLSAATLVANRGAGLIDRGIYGVIRHPMYLGAILLFLSWIFFLPHWIVVLVSVANSAIVYWFILQGDRKNIAKFGNAYRHYMKQVPRINLVAALYRILRGRQHS